MHMGELESPIRSSEVNMHCILRVRLPNQEQQVPLFLRSPTVPPAPELDEFSMSGTQIGHTNSLGLIPDNDTHPEVRLGIPMLSG